MSDRGNDDDVSLPATQAPRSMASQGRAHRPVRVMQPRTDRPGRHAEGFRQSRRKSARGSDERPGSPYSSSWQAPEASVELIAVGQGARLVRGTWSVERQDPYVVGPVTPPSGLAVAAPDQDPVEPGLEPVRIAETRQLLPRDHQCLLHRIL